MIIPFSILPTSSSASQLVLDSCDYLLEYYILDKGHSMVLIREPEAAEVVFRNEGQYPTRIQMLDDNLQWLFKKLNLPVPFPFLYAN